MFYVVSTDQQKSLLKQAHEFIRAVNRLPFPPMTPGEMIERGLLFAKTEVNEKEMAHAMLYYRFTIVGGGDSTGIIEDFMVENSVVLHDWWAKTKNERKTFRSRLAELVRTPKKAIARRKEYVNAIREDVLVYGVIDELDEDIQLRCYPLSNESAYKFVLYLLCKNDRWKRLKRCDYPKCRSFLFRRTTSYGGRPRDYCTTECQKQADQIKALIRQKKQRKRKAKKRGKKS